LTPQMSALNYERNQYCQFSRKVKNMPRAIMSDKWRLGRTGWQAQSGC
jgi:hypothetical protein